MSGPMDGVRVLEMARVLAGPTVAQLMAEYGADVIKVEPAPSGDPARGLPYLRDGRSGYFIQANRGKRSVCVDFRSDAGTALILDLARHSDVLVESFRPGVLAEMGLGWDVLHAANPRLVLCSVTGLGYGGPLSHKPGYDTIGAAMSGVAHVSGPVGGPPMLPGPAMGDAATGVYGFGGVAAALFQRDRTGLGDWVQVSLLDTYMAFHEINIQAYSGSGGTQVPEPSGNFHSTVCPAGFFRCADRYLFIACVSPGDWPRIAAAIGRPELAKAPGYATNDERAAHRDEVNGLVLEWLAAVGDPEEALRVLNEHRVACELIRTVPEALAHPHNRARRVVRDVPDEVWGSVTVPGLPIRFAGMTERDLAAHELGADNRAVLREVLDLDDARIDELEKAHVLQGPATGTPDLIEEPS
jgi:crotonobetainyl-CoA:carnitine CoA-transferase CaiB-like acyl-CoA transferase